MDSSKLNVCPVHRYYVGSSGCPKCGWNRPDSLSSTPASVPEARKAPETAIPNYQTDLEPPDAFDGPEKILHRQFATDMQRRGVHTIHARTDCQSSIQVGLPDFHCIFTLDGITKACAVELKKRGGRLSPAQVRVIADMRYKEIPVAVCWTLADAINFCREHLGC